MAWLNMCTYVIIAYSILWVKLVHLNLQYFFFDGMIILKVVVVIVTFQNFEEHDGSHIRFFEARTNTQKKHISDSDFGFRL